MHSLQRRRISRFLLSLCLILCFLVCKMENKSNLNAKSSVHPLLRESRAPFPHGFSKKQMHVFALLCDTVIPSILPPGELKSEAEMKQLFDDAGIFYRLSASDLGVPDIAAGMVTKWTTWYQYFRINLALSLLGSRFGTLILCGGLSLSKNKIPFVRSFKNLPLERREAALRRWSQSCFWDLQMLFKIIKSYTNFAYYSKVDQNGSNPTWRAIGYSPAPIHPNTAPPKKLTKNLIDSKTPAPQFATLLADSGYPILGDISHLQKLYGKGKKASDLGIKCDVVVVGSGSGGGVAAGYLAKQGFKVIVVEKGEYFAREDLSLLEGPSMDAMYEQSGALTTVDGSVILLTGKTVGGGSAINWGACFKTPELVRKEWAEEKGLEFIGSSEYDEAMEEICRRMGVSDELGEESFQNQILRRGCKALGYPVATIPRNSKQPHSCGSCGFGCRSGKKQGTQETWLADAVDNGAAILTSFAADRILLSSRGCCGGSTPRGKPRRSRGIVATSPSLRLFIESKATIVACGALSTPPLLHRSCLCNPHIGRHLKIHPVFMAFGYFPPHLPLSGSIFHGEIMTSFSELAHPSGYGSILETPSQHPGMFSVSMPWLSASQFKEQMLEFSRTAALIAITRDSDSEGYVGESNSKPSIHYSLSYNDRQTAGETIARALRVLVAAGATAIGMMHVDGDVFYPKTSSTEELEAFIRMVTKKLMAHNLKSNMVSAHQMGSCRMGVDAKTSAVDLCGETWEVEGLFVGDGSVLPNAVGVNPMVTIQSIAYCIAKSVGTFLQQS